MTRLFVEVARVGVDTLEIFKVCGKMSGYFFEATNLYDSGCWCVLARVAAWNPTSTSRMEIWMRPKSRGLLDVVSITMLVLCRCMCFQGNSQHSQQMQSILVGMKSILHQTSMKSLGRVYLTK